jgi:hypothetical protein
MIGVTMIKSWMFRRLKKIQTALTILFVLIVFSSPAVSAENNLDIAGKLQKLKEQYQRINTVHLKSEMAVKTYIGHAQEPPSDEVAVLQISYEYWGDKNGNYRINSFFYDSNGTPEAAWESAYDGSLFQLFDKRSLILSYSAQVPDQNPCAPENPLFAPLLFLGRNDDSCRACTLKLTDVLSAQTWQTRTSNAQTLKTPDEVSGQAVMKVPGAVMEGKEFSFQVYFGPTPDYIPSKINWVDVNGNVINLAEIPAYQAAILNGIQVYWPKSVRHANMDGQGNVLVESTAEIQICQINVDLPADIFTIDPSSARTIWDNDSEMLLTQ